MILSKFTPKTLIELWHPLYHKRQALPSYKKVKDAKTEWIVIRFTKTTSPEFDGEWVISKKKALKYPIQSNGTIDVLAIPLDHLSELEYKSKDLAEIGEI